VLHAARWKCRTQKSAKNSPSGRHRTTCRAISSQLRHISTIGKILLNSNISRTCPRNVVNFGLLLVEIVSLVGGTPANFNGFRVLAALLHCTVVVGAAKLCGVEQMAPPILGRAAITLGIGPHCSSSFFPRLISAVAEWLSTVLLHMMWP